jgi:hypothetical protein
MLVFIKIKIVLKGVLDNNNTIKILNVSDNLITDECGEYIAEILYRKV